MAHARIPALLLVLGSLWAAPARGGAAAEPEWRVKPERVNVLLSTEAEGAPRDEMREAVETSAGS